MKYSVISFWHGFNYEDNYFTQRFLKNHSFTYDKNNIDLLFVGSFVNENEYNMIKTLNCIKVMYVSEPINGFALQLVRENVFNSILGSVNNNQTTNRYKFPLYLLYFNYRDNSIFTQTNEYVKTCNINQKNYCCLINRHDNCFTRTNVYNLIKNLGHVTCPSNLLRNTSSDELDSIGNVEYIKKFKFNICPENCIPELDGYITEKLLNCCLGGAIPIFCGWFDNIDEKIFNKNRILFFRPYDIDSIEKVYNKVKELIEDEQKFNDFYRQDVFMNTAYETCMSSENDVTNFFSSCN
jgi:hypothetical protein